MKYAAIGAIMLLACLLIAPAGAITIPAEDVNSYSYSTENGYVIYKIAVDNLPIGTNQSHVLYYKGYPYLLEVETWTEWAVIHYAHVKFTMPNGSYQETTTYVTGTPGSYKTTIQPVFRTDSSLLESGISPLIKVDLQIGLVPVSANFNALPIVGYSGSNALPLTSASGYFTNTATSDVYLYLVTNQEFKDTISTYNPLAGLPDLGAAVFQWTWNSVLGFFYAIPVIGPYIVIYIEYVKVGIIFVSFWTGFMVYNAPAIVMAGEVLIWAFAVINAPSGYKAFGAIFKNLYVYNVALVMVFVGVFNVMKELVVTMVDLVTKVVEALKPI